MSKYSGPCIVCSKELDTPFTKTGHRRMGKFCRRCHNEREKLRKRKASKIPPIKMFKRSNRKHRTCKGCGEERSEKISIRLCDLCYSKYTENLRKNKYGLTPEKFEEMQILQNNKCKLCGKADNDCRHGLVIDHCHSTQKVRGLLCPECNTMLGMARDNVQVLENAIKYLT